MDETNPTNSPQTPFEILKWHTEMLEKGIKAARDDIERQMKWYVAIFTLAIAVAGGLITFAGFLGYKLAVDNAVAKINTTLADDVRKKMIEDTTAALEKTLGDFTPQLKKKVDAVIDAQCSNVARLNTTYYLRSQNDTKAFLTDDTNSVIKAGVYTVKPTATVNAGAWSLVLTPN